MTFKTLTYDNCSRSRRAKREGSRWDVLVLTLRISQFLGVAPVSFHSTMRGFPARVSRLHQIYSYLFIGILHVSVLIGLVIDLCTESKRSVRTRTPTARFAWIVEMALVLVIISVGAFWAPRRLERTIHYLNIMDKVYSQIGSHYQMPFSRASYIATALYTLSIFLLYTADFATFVVEAVEKDKEMKVVCLYSCFYVELVILVVLEMQFMWIALFIEAGLRSLNKALEDFIDTVVLQRNSAYILPYSELFTNIPVKSVNGFIEKIPSQTKTGPNGLHGSADKFNRLVVSYSTILDVIQGINDVYGPLLVLYVVSFVLHFVITPFYFVTYLTSNNKLLFSLFLQIVFFVYHFLYMIMVIEPGYMTERQLECSQMLTRRLAQRVSPHDPVDFIAQWGLLIDTDQHDYLEYSQMLMGRLAQRVTPREPLADQLDVLMKVFLLNKVSYTPMKMFTLTRTLIGTVLGGVTTYLVIILQFQQLDIGYW